MDHKLNNRLEYKGSRRFLKSLATLVQILIMAVSVILIYTNSLNAPFVFDDVPYIKNDSAIRMTQLTWSAVKRAMTECKPENRPLSNLSFAINYHFGKYGLRGYHLVNIGIHLLAGIFLFFFIKITMSRFPVRPGPRPASKPANPGLIAFFAALLWLIHPVNTESVTYIVQRMTSLAAMFFILSLLLYAAGRNVQRVNPLKKTKPALCFAGCILAGVCAVASKENTATLPFVILLYEWFFFQDLSIGFAKRRLFWFIGAVFLFAGIALLYLGENPLHRILAGYSWREFTLPERVMTEFRVIIYYISLFFYPSPSRLNLDHDYPLSHSLTHPPATILCLSAIICLIGLALYLTRRHRLFSFCILCFFITLAIESSIVGLEIIYDHRTYLPCMMVSLLFVAGLFRYARRTWGPAALLCGIIIGLSLWTFQRNTVWSDKMVFWQDCVNKSPNDARPLNNLGNAFRERGRIETAKSYYEKAIQMDPDYAVAHNNLGGILARQKKYQQAIFHLNRAVSLDPNAAKAHNNLGNVYAQLGHIDQAIRHYKKALEISPDYDLAKINLQTLLRFKQKLKLMRQDDSGK